jgi:hypothetical protein
MRDWSAMACPGLVAGVSNRREVCGDTFHMTAIVHRTRPHQATQTRHAAGTNCARTKPSGKLDNMQDVPLMGKASPQ